MDFAGKPLIAYSIIEAQKSSFIDKIVVYSSFVLMYGPGYYFAYSMILADEPFRLHFGYIIMCIAILFPASIPGVIIMGLCVPLLNKTYKISILIDERIKNIVK